MIDDNRVKKRDRHLATLRQLSRYLARQRFSTRDQVVPIVTSEDVSKSYSVDALFFLVLFSSLPLRLNHVASTRQNQIRGSREFISHFVSRRVQSSSA
jgi:hypothetical protein